MTVRPAPARRRPCGSLPRSTIRLVVAGGDAAKVLDPACGWPRTFVPSICTPRSLGRPRQLLEHPLEDALLRPAAEALEHCVPLAESRRRRSRPGVPVHLFRAPPPRSAGCRRPCDRHPPPARAQWLDPLPLRVARHRPLDPHRHRLHQQRTRLRNHGTKFRIAYDDLPRIYTKRHKLA